MTHYRYEAVAANGSRMTGEREASSQDEIVVWLHRSGHVPIRADVAGRMPRVSFGALRRIRFGDKQALILLTRQIATLMGAGLPLDRVLDIAERTAGPADRDWLKRLADRVRGGSSLANALAEQSGRFPGFYGGMVRAAEAGASL